MGCVSSKADINDLHPNIFQVMNVDDNFTNYSPGQIEITDTDLVLHQRGKPPTKWPLSSLRKYGFDSEIFSFECGRRCATGPGIYAFRCRKAEQLFNLLQHYIQLRNIEDPAPVPVRPVQRRPLPEYLNPTNNPRPTLSRPGSLTSNGPISPVSVSTPPLEHNNNKRASLEQPCLIGTTIDENAPPYINLNANTNESLQDNSRLYMNVNTETVAKEIELNVDLDEDPRHNYVNINTDVDIPYHHPITSNSSPNLVTPSVPPTPSEVNYVELDLEPGKSAQAPPDSPQKTKSYVTIDFIKSNALSQSINHRNDEGECIRRTRHNSTISDVRHSNSISD